MSRRSLILAAILALGALSAAADAARADAAFRDGQYDVALREVASAQTADALAFRARTLLAKVMCGEGEPDRQVLGAALEAANAALALEPRHGEGRLQKAISLSLMTRTMSLGEASDTGYGGQAKDLAESVLTDNPANPYALGFLAVWHVEVHRRGGSVGAMVMGASLKTARRHYAEAVRIAPQDAGLRWQWARALAALDAKKYRKEIEAELAAAMAIDPLTELDRVMQARAGILLAAMPGAKPAAIETIAVSMH